MFLVFGNIPDRPLLPRRARIYEKDFAHEATISWVSRGAEDRGGKTSLGRKRGEFGWFRPRNLQQLPRFEKLNSSAKVAELADAPDLGSGGETHGGSTPPFRTILSCP